MKQPAASDQPGFAFLKHREISCLAADAVGATLRVYRLGHRKTHGRAALRRGGLLGVQLVDFDPRQRRGLLDGLLARQGVVVQPA